MQSTIDHSYKPLNNYKTFFNKVDDLLFVLSMDGEILEVNQTALQRLGYSKNELVGQSVLKIHSKERHPEAIRIISNILKGEEKYCPIPLITKKNETILVETKAIFGKWNKQKVIFGVSKDISKLAASEEKFSKVFHSTPAICAIIDVYTDKFIEVNNTFYQKLSYSEEQVKRTQASKLLNLSEDTIHSGFKELKETRKIGRFDLVLPTANGSKISVWGFGETVILEGKKFLYAVAIDVSDKKQADIKLMQSENMLKEAQSIAKLGYYTFDITKNVWECSESLNDLFEINEKYEKNVATWLDIVHPDYKKEMSNYLQEHVLAGKNEFDKEYKIIGVNYKTEKWVHGNGTLKFNEKGEPVQMFGTIQDISEKKESEGKIQKSENALKEIIKNTMGKGGQVFFDALVKSLSKITQADYIFIGENISINKIRTISLFNKKEKSENLIFGLKSSPSKVVLSEGTQIYTDEITKHFPDDIFLKELNAVAYIGTPVYDHKGNGIGIIAALFCKPISDTFFIKSIFEICSASVGSEMERNHASLKIKENEEILNKIFDHAPVIMIIVNKNAEIIKINRTASSVFGEEKKIENHNCKNVFNCIGDSVDAIGIGNSELCSNCLINNTLKKTLKTGKEEFKKEADIITLRESEIGLRTYLISSSLIEKGENLKVLLTFDDITDRKRIEEELLLSKEKSVYNEKRYRLLSNLTFEGIMLHQNRKVIDVNKALLKMTGYSYAELIGQDSMSFIFPQEYENYFKEKMMEEHSLPYETEIVDKRGIRFPVEIESRYFKQNDQRIRVSAIRDITERKEGEKKILQAVVNTEESERARFAQELHDGLGPILSNVQMYFQWLADEDDNKKFVFEKGNLSLKNAFATLREISNKLSPHILHNFGLVHAVNNFIETMVTKNIRIDFKTNIEGKRYSGNIETSLYRIITELVNNTIKYSGANKIGLELFESNNDLKLIYTDNGKGFNIDHVQKEGKGFGMINIRNRIKTIRGNISVKSEINKGVEVEISVPIK